MLKPISDPSGALVARYNRLARLLGIQEANTGDLMLAPVSVLAQLLQSAVLEILRYTYTSSSWSAWRCWMASDPYDSSEVLAYTMADWESWQISRYGVQALPYFVRATMLMPIDDFFRVANLILDDAKTLVVKSPDSYLGVARRGFSADTAMTYAEALAGLEQESWAPYPSSDRLSVSVWSMTASHWRLSQSWSPDGRCVIPSCDPYELIPGIAGYRQILSPRVAWAGIASETGGAQSLESLGVMPNGIGLYDTYDIQGGATDSDLSGYMQAIAAESPTRQVATCQILQPFAVVDISPIPANA
ncbi:MAG: hypothetical protein J5654_06240 [Victivallales bacterium]|nr:hypothetical protein [Victivallales bacterium]